MSNQKTPWRDEPVVVARDESGCFIVVPSHKLASAGDVITFKFYGCKRFEIRDRHKKLFVPQSRKKAGANTLRIKLSPDLRGGLYEYDAVCDEHWARGGSAPGIIIDP
jgi:hypothetical protein